MKYLKPATTVATMIAMTTTQVSAGGLAEPMMEPEVIEEASAGSGGYIVPLILLAIIVAVASSSSSTPSPSEMLSPG